MTPSRPDASVLVVVAMRISGAEAANDADAANNKKAVTKLRKIADIDNPVSGAESRTVLKSSNDNVDSMRYQTPQGRMAAISATIRPRFTTILTI
jgi:protein required for attachment to host cells